MIRRAAPLLESLPPSSGSELTEYQTGRVAYINNCAILETTFISTARVLLLLRSVGRTDEWTDYIKEQLLRYSVSSYAPARVLLLLRTVGRPDVRPDSLPNRKQENAICRYINMSRYPRKYSKNSRFSYMYITCQLRSKSSYIITME